MAATDQGSPPLTSTATITLMLSGQNTAAPQFSDVSTQVIIPENEPPGSLIIKLTAEDTMLCCHRMRYRGGEFEAIFLH